MIIKMKQKIVKKENKRIKDKKYKNKNNIKINNQLKKNKKQNEKAKRWKNRMKKMIQIMQIVKCFKIFSPEKTKIKLSADTIMPSKS